MQGSANNSAPGVVPEIWFLQVENQFALANIINDATKFNYIVANLESAYISEVREIIVSPPATDRSLWLGRLPSSIQAILASQSNAGVDTAAKLADAVFEVVAPRIQISETATALESTIEKLTAELAEMKIQQTFAVAQPQTNTYCIYFV
ncbi:unnamed protein product [Diabrotica balteata]|uniref:DUF7041 domain-containing protein n=1 Tax=Diabrotica balteata TaxID=107213 RepID=A0A9N9XGI5_DIABA|nr:unnamed protein product [Diabrotica balteata]